MDCINHHFLGKNARELVSTPYFFPGHFSAFRTCLAGQWAIPHLQKTSFRLPTNNQVWRADRMLLLQLYVVQHHYLHGLCPGGNHSNTHASDLDLWDCRRGSGFSTQHQAARLT